MLKRIHIIVLDSLGVGESPDAAAFGDVGSNTLGHIAKLTELKIPNLEQLGIGCTTPLRGIGSTAPKKGYTMRLLEKSAGKDTMTGHWELMGLVTESSFPVYPTGFPQGLLDKIEAFSGRGVVCNLPYSGTSVIDDYADIQRETGALIVYTSADPVLQIAAHEEIIPLEELYSICKYVRSITLDAPWQLGRIIARPYLGEKGSYYRTPNRHDYAVSPPRETVLDALAGLGFSTIGIGKIGDIFNMRGISESHPTKSNTHGVDTLLKVMSRDFEGISFLNLVDFDALYGHRRDVAGYGRALEEFDTRLPEILAALRGDDLLLITADHGTDPAFMGTDHTREYVPLLAYSHSMTTGGVLPDGVFGNVAEIIGANFGLGESGLLTRLC